MVVVVVGQASLLVRKTTSHPSYGQAAPQGASSVAVGMAAGQPQGLATVVTSRQLPSQAWEQAGLTIDLVTVGQAMSALTSATTRLLSCQYLSVCSWI